MFEEKKITDMISYRDSGHIEVREAILVLKDGVEIAKTYHRYVVEPDVDEEDIVDAKVKKIAKAVKTDRAERKAEKLAKVN